MPYGTPAPTASSRRLPSRHRHSSENPTIVHPTIYVPRGDQHGEYSSLSRPRLALDKGRPTRDPVRAREDEYLPGRSAFLSRFARVREGILLSRATSSHSVDAARCSARRVFLELKRRHLLVHVIRLTPPRIRCMLFLTLMAWYSLKLRELGHDRSPARRVRPPHPGHYASPKPRKHATHGKYGPDLAHSLAPFDPPPPFLSLSFQDFQLSHYFGHPRVMCRVEESGDCCCGEGREERGQGEEGEVGCEAV